MRNLSHEDLQASQRLYDSAFTLRDVVSAIWRFKFLVVLITWMPCNPPSPS